MQKTGSMVLITTAGWSIIRSPSAGRTSAVQQANRGVMSQFCAGGAGIGAPGDSQGQGGSGSGGSKQEVARPPGSRHGRRMDECLRKQP